MLLNAVERAGRTLSPVLQRSMLGEIGRRLCRWMSPLERLPRPFGRWSVEGRFLASAFIDPKGTHGIGLAHLQGLTFVVDPAEIVGRLLVYGFPFERFELGLFSSMLRPDDVVLDIGANFGLYSIVAEARLNHSGIVHAFEPNPDALSLLQRNLGDPTRHERVRIHPIAVGAETGMVKFLCSEDSAFSSVIDNGRNPLRKGLEVRQTTLDSFVAESALPGVDLVKIDVEGYEPEVLSGGESLLSRPDAPILLIEIATPNLQPRGLSQADVVNKLEMLGYDVRSAEPQLPRVRDLDSLGNRENFLAVKPSRLDRLLGAAGLAH